VQGGDPRLKVIRANPEHIRRKVANQKMKTFFEITLILVTLIL